MNFLKAKSNYGDDHDDDDDEEDVHLSAHCGKNKQEIRTTQGWSE